MDSPQRAAVEFSLAWQSEFAAHTDRFHTLCAWVLIVCKPCRPCLNVVGCAATSPNW
jgi:hypothetical protein